MKAKKDEGGRMKDEGLLIKDEARGKNSG